MANQKRDWTNKSGEVAEKEYEPAGYTSASPVEQGLAITHEQVTDAYTEGTPDGAIDPFARQRALDMPEQGYEGMFSEAADRTQFGKER